MPVLCFRENNTEVWRDSATYPGLTVNNGKARPGLLEGLPLNSIDDGGAGAGHGDSGVTMITQLTSGTLGIQSLDCGLWIFFF